MTELKVTNPETIRQFVQTLADHGVKLPLVQCPDDAGTLLDANEDPVLVVDDDALQSAFAEERGIYPGGQMWILTPAGHERWKASADARASNGGVYG